MTDSTADEYFSASHKRLLRFASVANVFVWIVVVVTILLVISQIASNIVNFRTALGRPDADLWTVLSQDGVSAFRFITGLLRTLFEGLATAIVLRGVALALDMVVETDLNYRHAASEEAHE